MKTLILFLLLSSTVWGQDKQMILGGLSTEDIRTELVHRLLVNHSDAELLTELRRIDRIEPIDAKKYVDVDERIKVLLSQFLEECWNDSTQRKHDNSHDRYGNCVFEIESNPLSFVGYCLEPTHYRTTHRLEDASAMEVMREFVKYMEER